MKFKLFTFALLGLLIANCTRESLPEIEKEGGKMVTISAAIPAETRVAYTDSDTPGSGGTLAWESGDQLMLVGYDNENVYKGHKVFSYVTGTVGDFTGETVSGATKYKAYYPADAIVLDPNHGVHFDKSWQQTQNDNNSTAHLGDKLCLCDESGHALNLPFKLNSKNNILRLNLTGIPADLGTLQRLIWTVEYETGKTRSTCLDFTNYTHTSGGELIAFLAFDPIVTKIAAGGNVKITLIGDKSYEWQTPTPITNGKTYTQGNTRYYASVSQDWYEVAPLMYTIKTDYPQTEYGIKQPVASSQNPANLTIYWGDGTENTVFAQNATLSGETFASHNYAAIGIDDFNYTITIISDQADTLLKQMPQITFENDVFLTAILTHFPNMGATDFNSCFSYCYQLTSIPADLFRHNTQAMNFAECFTYCTDLTSIPAELFKHNTQATSFKACFLECSGVTSIPTGLFDNNLQAIDFETCFYNCTGLTSIPTGLFNNNTEATFFYGCFSGCTGLTSIPTGLFNNNLQAIDFGWCFGHCNGLTSIPSILFGNNTQEIAFDGCFFGCTGLTSIPAGLFNNNTHATYFDACFSGCTGLTSIPAGLFNNNTYATYFNACFSGCTGLTSIPAGLFNNNIQAISFWGCFSDCTGLTSIPAGLFNNNIQAISFWGCFSGCTKLELIAEIFPDPSTNAGFFVGRTMNFSNCFQNVGTQATSPGIAPRLWEFTDSSGWTVTNCFTNANVTNYGDIPPSWKGL